ncbi:Neurotransmitter-gated ion-channel ligand binding domain protein [Teladorsagia circumcincta]|uniref:Neurotransmitter-gated ion-channel ligand binding domain protein n=1 Tax=Teladorsagia circumcincta TaxID=45464 RepID=A0A2G9USJ6_TELCI|nr:Neurotransmitter-gated ion-channel ligand binding domain protein [Teladorsagia circumcincta]
MVFSDTLHYFAHLRFLYWNLCHHFQTLLLEVMVFGTSSTGVDALHRAHHMVRRPDCDAGHHKGSKAQDLAQIIMHNYSSLAEPAPVEVLVEITIQDISDISAITGTFVIDFWISAFGWIVGGLAFDHLDPCRKNLSLDHDMEPRLWSPNVCVVNSKLTKVHDSPKPNILLMIFPNGTVWLNYRVRSEAPCRMDLRTFPLDSIKCTLLLESYSYNSAEVSLRWLEWSPVSTVKDDYNLPDFKMSNMTYDAVTETYTAGLWHRLALKLLYSRSIAEISLRRTKGSELGAAIDKAASIAFPIAFALFNMAYWIYYMSLSSRTRH